ncbi:hypothetical protein CI109_100304 [Kwoniella shandongensis]|uniref:Uncharacterized protein n=1 Tax=Kwoniella shandongensis TaxID=1734106 RepID=A0A5M6C566_9TREE|nr:uncharacterized protein CI109_001851 [Kwoniella shandongensis]KAA5529911.1 hypothetical protein CI109_001851 [Kwoniella shandongensis]
MTTSQPEPVRVSYSTLLANPEGLHDQVVSALGSGPGCLGIILISDLPPAFPQLRERLFRLAHRFANLPEPEREKLARPETSFLFGWSHGKEVMNGRPDTQKGSYYANPLLDTPNVSDELKAAHPEYYAGNVWPTGVDGLEEFEETFKSLGKVIFDAGIALAKACESFVSPALSSDKGAMETLIASSKCNKARLLHYYPEPPSTEPSNNLKNDALCGTHLDHSLLTGLCSAMYLTATDPPEVVPSPSDTTGLWIYPRNSEKSIKVSIPEDCLAFQTGEALSILTSNKLAATPHFVSGSTSSENPVSRETFAFFLQPDVDDVIGPDGETFGQFTKRVLGRHYAEKAAQEAED